MARAETLPTVGADDGREPAAKPALSGRERELNLVGTGSFAVEVAEWAQDAGWAVPRLIELQDVTRMGRDAAGREVVGLEHARGERARAAIAMGGARRERWRRLEQLGWRGGTIVHPRAHVSRSARLAEGCIVGPGATIGAETTVGEHTLISRGALVGHHVQVGAFSSLLPGANVGGGAQLGEDAMVGMGAVILNGVRVGARATVAAGALVRLEVRAGSRVQGVPAREYRG